MKRPLQSKYAVRVKIWTEPNKQGNMSLYYVTSFRGGKCYLGGTDNKLICKQWTTSLKYLNNLNKELSTKDLGSYEVEIVSYY